MSSFSPAGHWPVHQSLPSSLQNRHQRAASATTTTGSPSFYPSPPIDFITTQQQQQQQQHHQHQQGQLQPGSGSGFSSPLISSPLSIEHKFSPGMPAVTLQQHPATSALAAALQYHAMGQTSDASLELSATLTEILSCLNTGLISKEEYVNERNTALHAWAVRSEDRMILLKGLKDAWSAKMVTDQEYDALSASLFGSSSELFSSSIPSHAGMSDEMVGSWLGSSVPDDDMFGSSFPGVDASADMYQSHRQRQSHGQRRATNSYYAPSPHSAGHQQHGGDSSQMYGSPAQAAGGIPIPMHRNSTPIPSSFSNSYNQHQHSYQEPSHTSSLSFTNGDGGFPHHSSHQHASSQPQHVQHHHQNPSQPSFAMSYDSMNSHMPGNLMSQSAPPVQFMPQHGRSNSMNNVGHSIVTSGMMGQQQHQQQQQRGSPMMTQQQMLSQPGKAKKDWRSKNPPNPQLLNTQIHQMLNSLPPAAESTSPPPPSTHRGFGASARQYNCDGSASVSEFRLKWRCRWCLCSGKYTPALRKGPLGAKTLCNACGMWYNRHGFLPQERYREHAGGNQGGAGSATGSGPNTDSDSGTPTVPKLEMPILSPLNTTSMPMMLASPGVSSPTSPDSPYGSSFQDHHLHHRRLHEPSSDMRRPPHPPVSHLQRHPSVTGTSGPRYPHSPPLPAGAAAAASQLHQMGYSSAGGSLSSAGHMQHQQQQHQRQQQQQQSLMQQMDTYQHVGQQQQPPPDLDFQDPNDDWLFGTSQGAAGTAQVSTSMPVVRRPGGW